MSVTGEWKVKPGMSLYQKRSEGQDSAWWAGSGAWAGTSLEGAMSQPSVVCPQGSGCCRDQTGLCWASETPLPISFSVSLAGTPRPHFSDTIKDLKGDMQFALEARGGGGGGTYWGGGWLAGTAGDFRRELPQQILRQKILFLSP